MVGNALYGTSGITGAWFAHPSQGLTTNFTFNDVNKLYVGVSANMQMITSMLEAVQFIQIEPGSTATDYEPYTGTTHPLTLPSTVYGGELDAVTGEGVETWAAIEFDGSETWAYNVDFGAFYSLGGDLYDTSIAPIVNRYIGKVGLSGLVDGQAAVSGGAPAWFIAIKDQSYSDVNAFKAALAEWNAAGTPLVVARKRKSSMSFTATGAQSIPALSGVNTVYSDADSVTVTGRADPIHTIQALSDRVAALETAAVTNDTGGIQS